MLNIRPVSDLRNKFAEIEALVQNGETIYLTKNGYGTMVVMSLEALSILTDPVERALIEADIMAEVDPRRLTHEEVFSKIRDNIKAKAKKL